MVDDGVYSVDNIVDEGLEEGLAGAEWALKGVKGHQRGVLEVLGEQRVGLSVWVCHIAGIWKMLLDASWET